MPSIGGRSVRPRSSSLVVVPMRTGDTLFAESQTDLVFPSLPLGSKEPSITEILQASERGYALYGIFCNLNHT